MAVWDKKLAGYGASWARLPGYYPLSCKSIYGILDHYLCHICTIYRFWRRVSSLVQTCRSPLFTTSHGDVK